MNAKPTHLEQIQRWMQSVIMHPGGVAEGVASPEARQHLEVTLEDLESVIGRSQALTSAARLEIYVDAYHERLMECLREEFVATRAAVGDELFEALAFGYLQHYPSHSYTLNTLGANFPKFLAESRLHAHEMPAGAGASWPEAVIELATFERVLRDVFDGPGIEGGHVLEASELAEIPAEQWGSLRLVAAPSVRLCRFEHPVHLHWSALKNGDEPPAVVRQATCLAIHRRAYVVERHELLPAQYALLEQIVAGQTLGEAIGRVTAMSEVTGLGFQQELPRWFAQWAREGFFVEARFSASR